MARWNKPGPIVGRSGEWSGVDQALVSNAMAHLTDMLAPVDEAVEGFRQQALRRGYSEDHAQVYALQCHRYILDMLLSAGAS